MPYVVLEDFAAGLDLRKSAVSAKAGSLRTLRNAYVNAGGEVEKRKAFDLRFSAAQMAAGQTFGLTGLSNQLWTFGANTRPAALDAGVQYQQLSGVGTIVRIRDADIFDGKLYVVAEAPDGSFKHFYNGAAVTSPPNSAIVRPYRSRMWGVANDTLYYSKLLDPSTWASGSGGGSISLDTRDMGTMQLRGMEVYYNTLAIFGRYGVQTWSLDEDPAKNQVVQLLGNTGLVGERAYGRYGDGDVLYLHDSGLRSLRARDASNAAIVVDTGSPIDELMRARIAAAGLADTSAGFMPDILSVLEPETGQFWLAWGSTIYVLSTIPSTRITAWAVYEAPAAVNYITTAGGRVYLRCGDAVYVYGGVGGLTYDSSQCELVTPMVSAGKPATEKMWTSFDLACEGTWEVSVGTDVQNPGTFEYVGTVTGPTFGMQQLGLQNAGTHIALRLRSTSASRARLGQIILHFREGASG